MFECAYMAGLLKFIIAWSMALWYYYHTEQSCHCKGVGLPSYKRWEVVHMNFSFQDLMAFGLLIVALLTFIFDNRK